MMQYYHRPTELTGQYFLFYLFSLTLCWVRAILYQPDKIANTQTSLRIPTANASTSAPNIDEGGASNPLSMASTFPSLKCIWLILY